MSSKHQLLYIDPPWNYNNNQDNNSKRGGCPYPQMTFEELADLSIRNMADKNCLLFLWTTAPKANEAMELIKIWGFRYITVAFTWIKTNKNDLRPRSGLGYWTNTCTELVLLGKIGKVKRIAKNVKQAVETDTLLITETEDCRIEDTLYHPIGEHSKKPVEVVERIDKLVGDIPKAELFSREDLGRSSWDYYGNEIDGLDINEALKNFS